MFQFVTVSHPDQIKDRKKQGQIRQHAIRNGIQRSKADRAKKNGTFVAVEINGKTGQPCNKALAPTVALTRAPSIGLLDPFDTLCGCPERLRTLMRHPAKSAGEPIFCVEESGKIFFQGMETIFKGALADPSLFHALSLVLSLAANNNLPNVEVLSHRGELLTGIRLSMRKPDWTPKVSTLTAMLLLIGYEYRIDGANSDSIATHIRGVQMMMKACKERNIALIDEVQRALFWQDLISCLMAGTPRLLSHKDFRDFKIGRDVANLEVRPIPPGFAPYIDQWSEGYIEVVRDLIALAGVVDSKCGLELEPLEVLPIDNDQANLESRVVDLLSEYRRFPSTTGPIYEACIFAAYLCTYKLSTGIWMGCYIPEVCVNQIIRCVSEATRDARWKVTSSLLLWLLFVSGGLTDRRHARVQVIALILDVLRDRIEELVEDWNTTRSILQRFIWSDRAMERTLFGFWQELQTSWWGKVMERSGASPVVIQATAT